MNTRDAADPTGRLAQLRATWPSATWHEVRAEQPDVLRSVMIGAVLLVLAVAATVATGWLFLSPTVGLPGWLETVQGLLLVVAFFGSISLWVVAIVLLGAPAEVRRTIAMRGFASQHGLSFAKTGLDVEPLGLHFAERSTPVRHDSLARLEEQRAGAATALFRSRHSVYDPVPKSRPRLQIGLAAYAGSKHDSRGPRAGFRFLRLRLSRPLPHLVIDSRRNGSLRLMLPGSMRLSLEGDFDRYFTVYVPTGYERDALELLTPDVMACLIDTGKSWDIEIVENQLVVISSRVSAGRDRDEVTALLHFAELFGAEIGHQAATYSDPRAARPRTQVAAGGRRLRRRSWMLG